MLHLKTQTATLGENALIPCFLTPSSPPRRSALPQLFLCLCLALSGVGLVGCATDGDGVGDDGVDTREPRARHGNLSTRGLEVVKVDLNGDDRPDQWSFFNAQGRLLRVERDLNFNGQIDMWQYYSAEGDLIEEEMALDTHGVVDLVVFYRDGKIREKWMSTGFDGLFPIRKYYDGQERLLRVERDSNGDGRPDIWEFFENGQRVRIGWDTNGDGQADSFDQL